MAVSIGERVKLGGRARCHGVAAGTTGMVEDLTGEGLGERARVLWDGVEGARWAIPDDLESLEARAAGGEKPVKKGGSGRRDAPGRSGRGNGAAPGPDAPPRRARVPLTDEEVEARAAQERTRETIAAGLEALSPALRTAGDARLAP